MSYSGLITSQLIYGTQQNREHEGKKRGRYRGKDSRRKCVHYSFVTKGVHEGTTQTQKQAASRISISVINYGCCLMSPNCYGALRGPSQQQPWQKSRTFNVEPSTLNVSSSIGSAFQKHGSWTCAPVVKLITARSAHFIHCMLFVCLKL